MRRPKRQRDAPKAHRVGCLRGLTLLGCSVGPNYVRTDHVNRLRPTRTVPWKPAEPRDQEPRGHWWGKFSRTRSSMRWCAGRGQPNQTIKAAEARVREARALTQQARARLFPLASAERQRIAKRHRRRNCTHHSDGSIVAAGGVRNNYNARST